MFAQNLAQQRLGHRSHAVPRGRNVSLLTPPPDDACGCALAHAAIVINKQCLGSRVSVQGRIARDVRALAGSVWQRGPRCRDKTERLTQLWQRSQAQLSRIAAVGGEPELPARKRAAVLGGVVRDLLTRFVNKVADATRRLLVYLKHAPREASNVMPQPAHLARTRIWVQAHAKRVREHQALGLTTLLTHAFHLCTSVAAARRFDDFCRRLHIYGRCGARGYGAQYSYRVVVRPVTWPRDIASVARSLARASGDAGAWFWLDGAAVEPSGEAGLSYLGAASLVTQAVRGSEREFLGLLRDSSGRGTVFALGYEFGVAMLGEDPAADDASPAFALHPEVVLVLDHTSERAELHGPDAAALDDWLAAHGDALEATPPATNRVAAESGRVTETSWNRSDAQYLDDVAACKRAIRDGDAYVLCLTDTARAERVSVDPLALYLLLRDSGAAIRGAVIVTADRALVSASPERFLSKRGVTVSTHPIKGTRPRGETAERDEALARELAADPKERAENLMIVDLMRNDLSRVCEPGSVQTEGFLRVEHHPRVHQLVSTVSGRLLDGLDVYDALAACFPGGSMTGAPKRRAVQLLAALEQAPRGLYSGCFGWVEAAGDAEIAMTIRSIELRSRRGSPGLALVGAGGGVTADSNAASELAEKQLKAAPLLAALHAVAER